MKKLEILLKNPIEGRTVRWNAHEYKWSAEEPPVGSHDRDLWHDSYVYEKECDCGKRIKIKTQEDNRPEYHADIYVTCQNCSAEVHFALPVN